MEDDVFQIVWNEVTNGVSRIKADKPAPDGYRPVFEGSLYECNGLLRKIRGKSFEDMKSPEQRKK